MTSPPPGIGVFHPGTQHSWQTALALQGLDRLAWYATSIYYRPERWPYRAAPLLPGAFGRRVRRKLGGFRHPELDLDKVHAAGATEWFERIASNLGARRLANTLDALGNRRFARSLDPLIGDPRCGAVWGYDGSSLEAFEFARDLGKVCILDRTSSDGRAYNALIPELEERWSEWLVTGERAIPDALIERDEAEYEAADAIVCGASYAAETVRRHSPNPAVAAKLKVIPYCYDSVLFDTAPPARPLARNTPVRFLFLGQVVARKGIQHLLQAIVRIPRHDARLTVVGKLGVPAQTFARFADRIDYLPPVDRREVPAIMARHDVLVLPSYYEGSSLTLIEALAAGLGVIQTAQSGDGADEATGIVIDRPDSAALHAAMMAAIEDRDRLDGWRAAAPSRARRFSFAAYGAGVARLLDELGL